MKRIKTQCRHEYKIFYNIYWLMEQFYTHDDDYKLISSKPFATL